MYLENCLGNLVCITDVFIFLFDIKKESVGSVLVFLSVIIKFLPLLVLQTFFYVYSKKETVMFNV